jgi:glutamine amidotransferase
MGNIASIQKMLKKIGYDSELTNNRETILNSQKIILPGVGAFDYGMKNLKDQDLIQVLRYKAIEEKTPLLGICLGMQLLGKSSEEGEEEGLSLIDFNTIKFKFDNLKLKIPHMGWNYIEYNSDSKLFKDMYEETRYYFVHSYYVENNDSYTIARANYGFDFSAAVRKDNILGVQFHPEKSHKFGMKLLQNFVEEF